MTVAQAQPTLFDLGSNTGPNHQLPVIQSRDVMFKPELSSDHVTGTIRLSKPNPRSRVACKVDYRIPESWRPEHHLAAVKIACHWFRDIGGFQTLRHSQLCHIIRSLINGEKAEEIHEAITAYANAKWHKENKKWTTIAKFFMADKLATWIDNSEKLRKERVRIQNKVSDKRFRVWLDKQNKIEQDERQAKKAELQAIPQLAVSPKTEPTLNTLIERLPRRYRWVIASLFSKTATEETKRNAKVEALKIWPIIWKYLPKSTKQTINLNIQVAWIKRGFDLDRISEHAWPKTRLNCLMKLMQSEYRQPKLLGGSLSVGWISS